MLAIAALIAWGLVPDGVTLTMRATLLPNVLAELGKQTGEVLESTPQFENEVLLVRVTGLPTETVLSAIASAAAGRWEKTARGRRLIPDTALRNKQETDAMKRQVEAIQKQIAQLTAVDPAIKSSITQNFGINTSKVLGELLKGINPRTLASVPVGGRIVFSTEPTQMQLPFGSNASQVISALVAQHNKEVQGRASDVAEAAGSGQPEMPEFMRQFVDRYTKPIGSVSKANLIFQRQASFFGQVSLDIYNEKGESAYTAQQLLGEMFNQPADDAALKPSTGTSTPIELSPDSVAIFSMQPDFRDGQIVAGKPIPAETLARLRKVTITDPLSLRATDEVLGWAAAEKKNVVALLPDAMMVDPLAYTKTMPTVEAFRTGLDRATLLRASELPGVTVLSPADPIEDRRNRVNRRSLEVLLSASAKKGIAGLLDLAEFARTSPSPTENGVLMLYSTVFMPEITSLTMVEASTWDGLRLFGNLGALPRKALADSRTISFSALPAGSLAPILFGASARPVTESADDGMLASMMAMMGGGSDGYKSEVTEIMPNGVPAAGSLSAAVKEESYATEVGTEAVNAVTMGRPIGADELAMYRLYTQDKNMAAMSAFMPKLKQLRVARRTRWTLTFRISPDRVIRQTLYDHRLDGARTVSGDALPADFEAEVAKQLAELKKSPLGSLGEMMRRGGAGRPPPVN